jgi:hypothetical protein
MSKKALTSSLIILILLATGCSSKINDTRPEAVVNGTSSGIASAQTAKEDSTPGIQPENSSKATPEPSKINMGKVTATRLIDGKSGWVGGNGWIARSDDNGSDWKVQYQGDQTVLQIFALNGQNAWAVLGKSQDQAPDYTLIYTDNGGNSWSRTCTLRREGFLHFNSVHEGFLANLHTVDGGKTWNAMPVPDKIVSDAYFNNKNHGWAVVQADSTVEIKNTIDGGKTWKTIMSRPLHDDGLTGALIRSAGVKDVWVEMVGGVGMTQQSYSLFHTTNRGESWLNVIANSTAGGGIAPGFDSYGIKENTNDGSAPGPLYVVNQNTAFMGGNSQARDNPNTLGWTNNGGRTWVNGNAQYPGYGGALLAMADETHGWWICTDNSQPSKLYTTSDGGKHWINTYTFDKP